MNVALAAHGHGVAETLRDGLNRTGDVALRLGLRLERRERLQRRGGQQRARPRPKILCGEFCSGDVLEILVDVGRVDHLPFTAFVDVLEQLVAGQIAACLDDLRKPPVLEIDGVPDAALAAELESHLRSADLRVLVAHRRQPEGMIVAGVLLVADADQRLLQQLYDSREHFLPRQPPLLQIGAGVAANARKHPRERDEAFVLRFVTLFAPARMVAVLFASTRVAPRRLNVAVGVGTDPHVRPRRRDDDRSDALELGAIGNRAAVGSDVAKTVLTPEPADAGRALVVDMAEVDLLRGFTLQTFPRARQFRHPHVFQQKAGLKANPLGLPAPARNISRVNHRLCTSAVACLAVAASLAAQAPQPYDVLIKGGRVLDGSGNPWLAADIGIRGARIVGMGRLGNAAASRVIDARGLTVSPGFIDVHSHASDGLADTLKDARQLIAQGITTVALNPDGGGPVDLRAQRIGYEQRGVGVNVALYVPHGSIRREVLGMADRAPSADELAKMVALAKNGMEAGGIGLSSGLYYAPGNYAKTDEVIALAKVVGDMGGVYESHIRDEADFNIGVVAAVDEVIRISEEGHLPGIVAHMKALGPASWGLSMALVERIRQARERGVEVYADQYPYDASGTGIVGALIPRWAEVGGRPEMLKRIQGPERQRLAADIRRNFQRRGGADKLVISLYRPNRSLEGQTLAAVSKAMNEPPEEAVMDLLVEGEASLVSFNMSEDDVALIMKQPFTMTCTDGNLTPFGEGKPHPRGNGAFARKIHVYVNERGVVDLPFAVRSMTSLPASVFGMKDRGVLRPGAWADILVFDPKNVRDAATYTNPHQLAEGMEYVLVNGVVEKDAQAFTGKLGGRVITPDRR